MRPKHDRMATAEVTINAPRSTVWEALITPAAMKQYMFGADVRSEWTEGASITWAGDWRGTPYQDKGVITLIQRERTLQYTHYSPLSGVPDHPKNYHLVTIDLAEAGVETRVIVTQKKMPPMMRVLTPRRRGA